MFSLITCLFYPRSRPPVGHRELQLKCCWIIKVQEHWMKAVKKRLVSGIVWHLKDTWFKYQIIQWRGKQFSWYFTLFSQASNTFSIISPEVSCAWMMVLAFRPWHRVAQVLLVWQKVCYQPWCLFILLSASPLWSPSGLHSCATTILPLCFFSLRCYADDTERYMSFKSNDDAWTLYKDSQAWTTLNLLNVSKSKTTVFRRTLACDAPHVEPPSICEIHIWKLVAVMDSDLKLVKPIFFQERLLS